MNPPTGWPDETEEEQLVTQLRSHDPTAREALAVRFLPLLIQFLARTLSDIEPELRDTAAEDAILAFVQHPDGFDATRARLGAYLRMAARRDLLNALERERRARRGIPLGSVEEPTDHRNETCADEFAWNHPVLAAEVAALNADEKVTLDLMRSGVRRTDTFVARLGLGHLSVQEQVLAIKRLKDRVKRRLTRALGGLQ